MNTSAYLIHSQIKRSVIKILCNIFSHHSIFTTAPKSTIPFARQLYAHWNASCRSIYKGDLGFGVNSNIHINTIQILGCIELIIQYKTNEFNLRMLANIKKSSLPILTSIAMISVLSSDNGIFIANPTCCL